MNAVLLLAQSTTDIFSGLDQNQRFALIIVVIGCATGVICVIIGCLAGVAKSIQRGRAETDLKRDLVERGLRAEEIERIVAAKMPDRVECD